MPYRLIASAKVTLSSEMIIIKNSIFILKLKFDTGYHTFFRFEMMNSKNLKIQ